jgi:hypothetical protein
MEKYQSMSLEEKETFWKKHIEEWQRSGLSMKQYSKQYDLKPRTFSTWKNKLLNPQPEQVLTEISSHIVSSISPRKEELEMILHNGLRIKISSGCSPAFLKQVLDTLGVKV